MGSAYGKPGLAIPSLYLQAALSLVASAGICLKKNRIVTTKMIENDITKYLNLEMEAIKQASESDIVLWQLTWHYRPRIQYDPSDPLAEGEIDLRFCWTEYPTDNSHYLAVEAKRLFGKGSSRADDYVDEGVMDFVNGKYSRDHSHGIMLGYIVVGPLKKAVLAVEKALATRRTQTAEHLAFCANRSICAHPLTHHSIHIQRPTRAPITLVHIFLDLT